MRSRSTTYREFSKKEVKPAFGSVRWDYIKACTHDLANNIMYCPMCLLVHEATNQYFSNELERREIAKKNSVMKRGKLRYELLQCWSRNQGSFYGEVLPKISLEVGFTDATVLSLYALFGKSNVIVEQREHLSRLLKLLERRKRIIEIGVYAATLIQKTVRSYCCRRRVIRFMLKRFELVYSKKGDYYTDKQRDRILRRRPYLLKSERPGSPRTVQRRLAAIDSKHKSRQKIIDETKAKNTLLAGENVWTLEAKYIKQLRQLLVLRDVLDIAFETIRKSSSQEVSDGRSRHFTRTGGDEEEEPQAIPVFISFSPPLPSVRKVSLAVVVARDQRKKEAELANKAGISSTELTHAATQEVLKKDVYVIPQPSKAGEGSKRATADSVLNGQKAEAAADSHSAKQHTTTTAISSSLNSQLALLEQRAWELCYCRSTEEVIRVLASDEIQAALGSSILIAGDECRVWNGEQVLRPPEATPTTATEDDNESEEGSDDEDQEEFEEEEEEGGDLREASSGRGSRGGESLLGDTASLTSNKPAFMREPTTVLPVHLQLSPGVPFIKRPCDVFRLIFKNGELSAVTPLSPWVYYKHVASHRDDIAQSILAFVQSPAVTALVKTLMTKANTAPSSPSRRLSDQSPLRISGGVASQQPGSQWPGRNQTRLPPLSETQSRRASVALPYKGYASDSLFVPAEGNLFGNATYKPAHLSDLDVERLNVKYKFLERLPAWRTRLKHVRLKGASSTKLDVRSESLTLVGEEEEEDGNEEEDDNVDGDDVYELCPLSSLSAADQTYETLLHEPATTTSIRLQDRICLPIGATAEDVPETPRFDIVAVDVFVEIPPGAQGGGRDSKNAKGKQSLAVAPAETGRVPLPVDIHRVVGVFTSKATRQPSSLDLGLFSWDFFCESKLVLTRSDEVAAVVEEQPVAGEDFATSRYSIDWPSDNRLDHREVLPGLEPLPRDLQPSAPVLVDELWTKPKTSSGVAVLRRVMPASGLVAELRFLCAAPTKEYLERRLPPHIKSWLGSDALVPTNL